MWVKAESPSSDNLSPDTRSPIYSFRTQVRHWSLEIQREGKQPSSLHLGELALIKETGMNPVVTLVDWQLQVIPDLWNNVLGRQAGG